MNDIKSWLQSRTIWAALVALSPVALQAFGFDLNAMLADVLTVAGALAAIYFRIKATKKLN